MIFGYLLGTSNLIKDINIIKLIKQQYMSKIFKMN